jgi:beta-galactosidase
MTSMTCYAKGCPINDSDLECTSKFNMGCSYNPNGDSWTLDNKSLIYNKKRVIPVMGEIHFSRIPEKEWRSELLKMKAGGVTIVATYTFWIHHEEIEGQFDWSGNRNLRRFLNICKEVGMPVVLRIGPFCHGECRNGGFPDWLIQQKYKIRRNDDKYLDKVGVWMNQIFSQVDGLMWKQGGPVIGMQIENEYRGAWEHLQTLKGMVQKIGFDLPFYTRTGWPKLSTPAKFGEIIPLYGDYCDGFWDRELTDMPGNYKDCYLMRSYRGSTVIATEQIKNQLQDENNGENAYPFLTCELGGGMETSYHRRIHIYPMDIYSLALVKVANGSNLPGYYMYHGGTNPEGRLTTMNERQNSLITNYNDMPVKSYDFQAPIGEFGQLNGQYHLLRQLHLFLHDFGEQLSVMKPYFPVAESEQRRDSSLLRWNYRLNGKSGFVFVNNYQRMKTLSAKNNVQFSIPISGEAIVFPQSKICIPSACSFILPFNMSLGQATLIYSTAQPISEIQDGDIKVFFFKKIDDVDAEFAFSKSCSIKNYSGKKTIVDNRTIVKGLKPGTSFCLKVNENVRIVLLSEDMARRCWKQMIAGKERMLLSSGSIICDHDTLSIEDCVNNFSVSIFPAVKQVYCQSKPIIAKRDGIFAKYLVHTDMDTNANILLHKQKNYDGFRSIGIGVGKVAEAPTDSDFQKASVWNIDLHHVESADNHRPFLYISYKGDVARLYCGKTFLDDNFYNGREFIYNLYLLKNIHDGVTLKILPFSKDAPIYLQRDCRFGGGIRDVRAKIKYLNSISFYIK